MEKQTDYSVSFLVVELQMDPEEAFFWAHDAATLVIHYIALVFFLLLIEYMGVSITERFADLFSVFKHIKRI